MASDGDRNHDPSINPDTGTPVNMTLTEVFGRVIFSPGEAGELLQRLAGLVEGTPASQHLRYVATEINDPAAFTPTSTTAKSSARSSGTTS